MQLKNKNKNIQTLLESGFNYIKICIYMSQKEKSSWCRRQNWRFRDFYIFEAYFKIQNIIWKYSCTDYPHPCLILTLLIYLNYIFLKTRCYSIYSWNFLCTNHIPITLSRDSHYPQFGMDISELLLHICCVLFCTLRNFFHIFQLFSLHLLLYTYFYLKEGSNSFSTSLTIC